MTLHVHAPAKKKKSPGLAKTISSQKVLIHAKESSAYFRRIRSRLYKNLVYRNKYVAIRDRKIVDLDADKFVLYERLLQTFPDHRFLVMPVWAEFPSVSIDSVQ